MECLHLQVLDVLEQMFTDIFKGIETECKLELKAVGEQYTYEPFVMRPMRFTFAEAVKVCSFYLFVSLSEAFNSVLQISLSYYSGNCF